MTITYEQAYEKLDSLVESAFVNLECEILTEGVDVGKAFRVVKATVIKFIDTVINYLKELAVKSKVKGIQAIPYTADTKKVIVDYGYLNSVISTFTNYSNKTADDVNPGVPVANDKLNAAVGSDGTISGLEMVKIINTLHKTAVQLRATATKVQESPDNAKFLRRIKADVERLNGWAKDAASLATTAAKKMKADTKAEIAQAKADTPKTIGESAVSRMAKLLIEAAAIVEECQVEAHPYVAGIEGGEGTQDPVAEIPEEKPAEGAEQDPAVSGGEGEPVDLEEIKELTGDDAEAIALMTKDEGSAVCESVTIEFGFDD